ncbi:hypothetical protein NDU88_006870 [Pleurodeles waltl]|uniref:Uncharacterized protein n=1 Tax=Pleurodeles waltl TaxID=8319 RepID=A0AAV7UNH7_PLEWA|nr:hypothetical protein NDU88_006870 [Pleurodeles waltl]
MDSLLTAVVSTSANQDLENTDRTARIEKRKANYNLLQDKLDNLENQSRCRNRGISLAVPEFDLETHVQALFAYLLGPDCDQPVLLDRTHRVFSLYQQKKNLPPDVLTTVHYFHLKEKIMQETRQQEPVVFRGDNLSIYKDVSTHTLARRTEFRDVTLHLRECKIVYQ